MKHHWPGRDGRPVCSQRSTSESVCEASGHPEEARWWVGRCSGALNPNTRSSRPITKKPVSGWVPWEAWGCRIRSPPPASERRAPRLGVDVSCCSDRLLPPAADYFASVGGAAASAPFFSAWRGKKASADVHTFITVSTSVALCGTRSSLHRHTHASLCDLNDCENSSWRSLCCVLLVQQWLQIYENKLEYTE